MITTNAKRPHARKQINVDIVAHVNKYGPCGFIELYDLFGGCKASAGKNALESFRARLNHLTYSQQLVATGTHTSRRWHALLQDAEPEPRPASRRTPSEPWIGTVAPPARNDVIHGPTYVPERGPVARSGSQDFRQCASRGHRC